MKILLDIAVFRLKHNLSQEDLARRIGVSMVTVCRWENGKSKPSQLAVQKMVEMGITEEDV